MLGVGGWCWVQEDSKGFLAWGWGLIGGDWGSWYTIQQVGLRGSQTSLSPFYRWGHQGRWMYISKISAETQACASAFKSLCWIVALGKNCHILDTWVFPYGNSDCLWKQTMLDSFETWNLQLEGTLGSICFNCNISICLYYRKGNEGPEIWNDFPSGNTGVQSGSYEL